MRFLFLFLITGAIVSVRGAKFLLVPPTTVSLCLEMMSIGQELLIRGHHVHLYAPFVDTKSCTSRWKLDKYGTKFKIYEPTIYLVHRTALAEHVTKMEKGAFEGGSFYNLIGLARKLFSTICTATFQDTKSLQQMVQEKYDMALIEAVPFASCLFSLSVYLDVPSVGVSSFILPVDSRMPHQSNIVPHAMTTFPNDMHFHQRLLNTLMSFASPLLKYAMCPQLDLSEYSEKLRGIDTTDLIKDAVLFIENTDYVIDYPQAVFPNMIHAGGLTAFPANPLPPDLKDFMDKAKEGVLIIGFGSILKHAPTYIMDNVKTAASSFKMKVIMKSNTDEVKGNVKTMTWLPQNDILGHPNTKLFISHCGKNSFWEGVYHGVPIICTPFNGDAFNTASKVKNYKVGSSVNLVTASVEEIKETIEYVLNSSSSKNMKRISTLLRDRPETPQQRAASAIEHVIKYGGDHLRPPEHNFLSYIYADVWLTIFVVVVLVVYIDIWVITWCCCRKKGTTEKKKTE